ncbi:NUDIX hydrolase [Fusibacillus kribbianus]|uniref:NUDIX domain-containing protein n=1 Tax=Fusibacillus kribbianus TaxID=3044208 RepID=A0AAP4BD48_9FIRM|nr:NUDIX domain-containing protein [Ruminococcus sp. YH-rum2234]MDI9243517.1 NUDIX domain-containing protein [Ruminococcus sp. YH-rum2234]
MEYFDVLTEEGLPAGRKKERTQVHRDGDWHGASRVWLVRYRKGGHGAEVLLQRRSPEKDSYPGLWDVSAAGHVSAGGNYLETAVRETEEELGVCLEPSELTFLFSLKSETIWNFRGESFTDREFHQIFLARKDVEPEKLSLQKEEVAEVRWMDAEELYYALKEERIASCIHWEEYERLYPILCRE